MSRVTWVLLLALAGCSGRARAEGPAAQSAAQSATKPATKPEVARPDARPVAVEPVVYKVRMTTTVVVPGAGHNVDQIRVWHALPTWRPWCGVSGRVGASDVRASAGGAQRHEAAHDSHHNFWQVDGRQRAGTRHQFTTDFIVRSARRLFVAEKAEVRWEDYARPAKSKDERVDPAAAAAVGPFAAGFADKVRGALAPGPAVLEFCGWIKNNIAYDASVPHAPDDVAATVRAGRGHCGHQYALLEQLCRRAGIPIRAVWGLNLYQADGRGELSRTRADWTNIHTWAEVFFPGIGWVELNPEAGAQAFDVPAHYIQNDKWFQNYAVWIRDNNVQRIPGWTHRDGRWVSECGIENLITFTIKR